MYSYFSSHLFNCCPQFSFLFPVRRNYFNYNDDEFEKYQPRPKIIIDPEEINSMSPSVEDCIIGNDNSYSPKLRIIAQYSSQKNALIIKVLQLFNVFDAEDEESCVRMSLNSTKITKQHTSFIGGLNPKFGETFSFPNLNEEEVSGASLRFRIYTRKGRSRAVLRAESTIEISQLSKESATPYTIMMERVESLKAEIQSGLSPSMHRASNGTVNGDSRRSSMVDSCGRFCSQPNNDAPELLISLSYDPDHGSVVVAIERGSQFGEKSKPPDTFIKIVASGEFGNEFSRQKTEMVKGSSEPQYDYTCNIDLPRNELDTTTVRIEVWQSVGILKRRHQMGWLAVGLNASSPDAQEHWQQMIQGQGIAVSKWHPLQPPE